MIHVRRAVLALSDQSKRGSAADVKPEGSMARRALAYSKGRAGKHRIESGL